MGPILYSVVATQIAACLEKHNKNNVDFGCDGCDSSLQNDPDFFYLSFSVSEP